MQNFEKAGKGKQTVSSSGNNRRWRKKALVVKQLETTQPILYAIPQYNAFWVEGL